MTSRFIPLFMNDKLFPFGNILMYYNEFEQRREKRGECLLSSIKNARLVSTLLRLLVDLKKVDVLELVGNLPELLRVSKKGIRKAQGIDYLLIKALFLRSLAVSYFYLSKFEDALGIFKILLDISIKLENKKMELTALGNTGGVYLFSGKHELSLEYFQKSIDLSLEMKDEKNLSIVYEKMGMLNSTLGNFKDSLKYYEMALEIAERTGNRRGEAILYGNIGNLFYYNKMFEDAFRYFKKGIDIANAVQDVWTECLWEANYGALLAHIGEEKKAISSMVKSLKITKKLKVAISEKICLHGLSGVFVMLKQYGTATEYAKMGLQLSDETDDNKYRIIFLILLGIIAFRLKQRDRASRFLRKSKKIAIESGRDSAAVKADLYLMRIELVRKKSMTVLGKIDSIIQLIKNNEEEDLIVESLIELGRSQKEMGMEEKAKKTFKEAQSVIEKTKLFKYSKVIEKETRTVL